MGCCKGKPKDEEDISEKPKDSKLWYKEPNSDEIPEGQGDYDEILESMSPNTVSSKEAVKPVDENSGDMVSGDDKEEMEYENLVGCKNDKRDYGMGVLYSDNDRLSEKFKIGKFHDEENDIWFRSNYLFENDSTRKLFLSLYNINLNLMTDEEFYNWCEENGFDQTKTFYKLFRTFDSFPYNRLLKGLTHKYEVNFHLSDMFVFKGKGPYRALTCYGRIEALVDRALIEFETRMRKDLMVPHMIKNWDGYCFPHPNVNLDPYKPVPPFPWPKRIKPLPPFQPFQPYNIGRQFPLNLMKAEGNAKLEQYDDQPTKNNSVDYNEMKSEEHIYENVQPQPTDSNVQTFFHSSTDI